MLLVILPLFIYQASFSMSWRDFRANLGGISLLAVGCVLFTTVLVAAACHLLLQLSWPVGFTLGAIVSPPDAVAPLAIARRMQIPRRILTILEGEGLANDATALVLYRFAVVAVSAGSISLSHASALFALIIVGRGALGHRHGLADAASAPLGARHPYRDDPVGADPVRRLLAARNIWAARVWSPPLPAACT